MVISGALSPTGFFGGGCTAAGCDDKPFLRDMVNAGALNYADCVGIHYNEGIVSPNQTSGDTRGNPNHYTRYYQTMVDTYVQTTGGLKPLCFTELGYLTGEGYELRWRRRPRPSSLGQQHHRGRAGPVAGAGGHAGEGQRRESAAPDRLQRGLSRRTEPTRRLAMPSSGRTAPARPATRWRRSCAISRRLLAPADRDGRWLMAMPFPSVRTPILLHPQSAFAFAAASAIGLILAALVGLAVACGGASRASAQPHRPDAVCRTDARL